MVNATYTDGTPNVAQTLLLVFSLLFTGQIAFGQSLKFTTTEHDFGRIQLEASLKKLFNFRNTTNTAVSIIKVESDCGCAVADYPKVSVSPNQYEAVTVSYLPYKYGKFQKRFLIHTSDGGQQYLVIKGEILPPAKQARDFPFRLGPFKVESRLLSFGKITNDKPVTKRFELFNPADSNLVLTGEMTLPSHLKVFFDTSHVAYPKSILPIFITYDPKVKNDLGFVADPVVFHVHTANGLRPVRTKVIATIEEYFPPLTEEILAEMPELSVGYTSVNLGTVRKGEVRISRFVLANKGPKPLQIRKIETDEGCEVETPFSEYSTILPNESISLQVRFKDLEQTGGVVRYLTLFTNDPRHKREMLEIKAYVK